MTHYIPAMHFPHKKAVPASDSCIGRVILELDGPSEVARLMERSTGYRFTRSTIWSWQANGRLPFSNHQQYARILMRAVKQKGDGLDVTKSDLINEVLASRTGSRRLVKRPRAIQEVGS